MIKIGTASSDDNRVLRAIHLYCKGCCENVRKCDCRDCPYYSGRSGMMPKTAIPRCCPKSASMAALFALFQDRNDIAWQKFVYKKVACGKGGMV